MNPILPWRIRVSLQKRHAENVRKAMAAYWPAGSAAGTAPPGWPGWPDGKQFAFILTHDVEGSKGLDRLQRLLELEKDYGFYSSFNLAVKGGYLVDRRLLDLITNAGFEAGMHGLGYHESLKRSKRQFLYMAEQIRNSMKKWDARGFRSPGMSHGLSWLHEIECEYDSSTFDSVPFEQRRGDVGTIFPFWVPGREGKGYVELPCTLVPDFPRFRAPDKPKIDIWKMKLDWIVKHNGMALLNTRPDYMCFDGAAARGEYSASYYEQFLSYVKNTYGDICWNVLPKTLSSYYRKSLPESQRNTRRKICMVSYSDYTCDNRVRRYAETLAKRGDLVDVIALNDPRRHAPVTSLNGVTVHHLQGRGYKESSHWGYSSRLLRFLFKASVHLTRLHMKKRYDVVHIHNMPDFLVFAAFYPKVTGASLILDIHDIVPELFSNKFKTSFKRIYVAALRLIEKVSARFVDHVIVSNDLWLDKLTTRSVARDRCSVLVNHVDPELFARRPRTRNDDKFIVVFPGTFQWHQGLDIGIKAFHEFKKRVPNTEFHLYGGGSKKIENELQTLVRNLGLEDCVKFCGSTSLDKVAEIIANADLGVVPKRADSFGNEAYSTKIMEFMSQGIPVVVSRTKIDCYYFDEQDVRFFPSGDSNAMAEAMCEVAQNEAVRESLIRRGLEYVAKHGWERKKKEYLDLIDRLATDSFDDSGLKLPLKPAARI